MISFFFFLFSLGVCGGVLGGGVRDCGSNFWYGMVYVYEGEGYKNSNGLIDIN